MSEVIAVGRNLAKNVFQLHWADCAGHSVLRKKLKRAKRLEFLRKLRPCVAAMEASDDADFRGWKIGKLGHEVRLIPRGCVAPSSSVRTTTSLMPKQSAKPHCAPRCASFR
ncbi:hypothetical protein AL035_20130 [Salipiger aestuarii]|nr:hypothetical protein AL035_20130 [Salipiger aestuarii]